MTIHRPGGSEPDRPAPWKRVASAILGFLFVLAVLWSGLPLLAPLYLFVCIVAIKEYAALMRLRGVPVRARSMLVMTFVTLPASLPVTYPGMQPLFEGVSWREALLGLYAFYLIAMEVAAPNERSLSAVIYSLFGYVWIPWLFGYMVTLRYTPDGVLGLGYLTLPVLAVIASDVGGYVFGNLFGRRPLAPTISPGKTLEGSLAGLALAAGTVTGATLLLETVLNLRVDVYDTLLFSVLVASAAQLGDLFASLLKRWARVKDTGLFLPGQGGVIDRIDSHLFAVPVTYYFVTLVVLR